MIKRVIYLIAIVGLIVSCKKDKINTDKVYSWVVYDSANGLASNKVSTITFDNNGKLWCGDSDGGLSYFDGKNWTTYPYYIKDGIYLNVTSIEFDDQNNEWLGLNGCSLTMYDGENWTEYNTLTFVSCITVDGEGKIWFGTYDGIVAAYDKSNWEFYYLDDNTGIYDIDFDSKGILWLGTYNGLMKFDGVNFTSYPIQTDYLSYIYPVDDIYIDENDNIWTASNCVAKFDGNNWEIINTDNGLVSNYVTSIAFDSDDNMWVGTQYGLSKFDGTKWTTFNTENGLPDDYITCIEIDKSNNLWFGTVNAGICKLK